MSSPSLPGDRERPADGSDPVAAEIEAEIADHLASSVESLQRQGVAPGEAQAKVKQQFGDAAAIGRRCWWIKQGDTVMLRVAAVVVIVLLCVGLAITTVGSWQAQSRMADQMHALGEQLKLIAESRPAGPAPPTPLEISGKVYIDSANQVVPGTEVTICRAADGEVVRRATTDDRGHYSSGPLASGDYTVLTSLKANVPFKGLWVQSEPVYVYPATDPPTRDLDAAYHSGRLSIETSRPLPQLNEEGKYSIESRLLIKVRTPLRSSPWTTTANMPPRWPLYVEPHKGAATLRSFWELLGNEQLKDLDQTMFGGVEGDLPAGECHVVAVIVSDVIPAGLYRGEAVPREVSPYETASTFGEREWVGIPYSLRRGRMSQSEDMFRWFNRPMGAIWFRHLSAIHGDKDPNDLSNQSSKFPSVNESLGYLDGPTAITAPIVAGETTRLRIEIPEDLESRIREVVEEYDQPLNFLAAVTQFQPFVREATITVLGHEPLDKSPPAP